MMQTSVPRSSVAESVAWAGPVTVTAQSETSLGAWAASRRAWIDDALRDRGAVLFKGFAVGDAAGFREASEVLCGPLLDYVYRSTPRTTVGSKVYTATEYRPDASIPMHNENAYQRDWPMRLAFCCVRRAETGGETPLALIRNVTQRIRSDVFQDFVTRGVMYVRNYGLGVDLPWETTFQTASRADVESYCRAHDINCVWLPDNGLRTTQVCHAVMSHPITGEQLWFNQAHLFHVSSLGSEDQRTLLDLFGEANLPRNAYFGDGGPLDEDVLAHIRCAYDAETIAFSWEDGDVLLVDNMQVAHGRRPYTGARQVLVAMGRAFSAVQAQR